MKFKKTLLFAIILILGLGASSSMVFSSHSSATVFPNDTGLGHAVPEEPALQLNPAGPVLQLNPAELVLQLNIDNNNPAPHVVELDAVVQDFHNIADHLRNLAEYINNLQGNDPALGANINDQIRRERNRERCILATAGVITAGGLLGFLLLLFLKSS
jgi:hypothetical protein